MHGENLVKVISAACVISGQGIDAMKDGLGLDDIDNAISIATELSHLVGVKWSELGPEALEMFKEPAIQAQIKAAVMEKFDLPDDVMEAKLEAIFMALLDVVGAVNAAYKAGLSVYMLAKELKGHPA